MEDSDIVFLGTELKLNIHIDPIPKHQDQEVGEGDDNEWNMADYDFEVEVFCSPKKVITITKEEAIPVLTDKNNYIVLVNTEDIGTGIMKVKVIAHIPDGDFSDNARTEVSVKDTGIEIIKTIE